MTCNQMLCLCRKINALASKINKITLQEVSFKVGTTTTLPAGEPATVTNVGTGSNIILNFGIPSGNDGATPVSITDGGINPDTGGHKYNLNFSDSSSFGFEAPKGTDGDTPYIGINGNWWINGLDTGISATGPKGEPGNSCTAAHVWMETEAATVTIPYGEDFFGVGTPKNIGFYSILGDNITDFTTAGASIKVNSIGTYLVSYQFVVKDTKCTICIRRKGACVEGGHLALSNPDGNILVSGTMIYIVSPEDIINTNGIFSIANEDNTRPLPIDPKSFSWTVTQLNKTYNPIFKRIPYN